jgi:hypothetical protein
MRLLTYSPFLDTNSIGPAGHRSDHQFWLTLFNFVLVYVYITGRLLALDSAVELVTACNVSSFLSSILVATNQEWSSG